MIALNWIPFGASQTGARRRAIELARRVTNRSFSAFVTREFPDDVRSHLPNVEFVDVADRRTRGLRVLSESRGRWWRSQLSAVSATVWSTDTLPVVRLKEHPTVLTVHDLRYLENPEYLNTQRYWLYRLTMQRSLQRADRVVVVSDWTATQLVHHLGTDINKIRVVPNGIDPTAAQLAEASVPPDTPYLLSVGHLEHRKNQQDLVRSLRYLGSRWRGKIVLVGRDAGSAPALRRLIGEEGVEDRVIMRGGIAEEELADLYRWCKAVVCPSEYEGFGMTLLEAFAYDKPVVASRIPPHVEVADDAAQYYSLDGSPEDRAEQLAEAIAAVVGDEARAAHLVGAGRERVGRFSWDAAATQLDSVYAEIDGA